jgi:hypothetical protein
MAVCLLDFVEQRSNLSGNRRVAYYRASINRRESHTPPHKEGTFPPRGHISGGLLWSARIVFAFLSESSAKGVRHSDMTVDLCD